MRNSTGQIESEYMWMRGAWIKLSTPSPPPHSPESGGRGCGACLQLAKGDGTRQVESARPLHTFWRVNMHVHAQLLNVDGGWMGWVPLHCMLQQGGSCLVLCRTGGARRSTALEVSDGLTFALVPCSRWNVLEVCSRTLPRYRCFSRRVAI